MLGQIAARSASCGSCSGGWLVGRASGVLTQSRWRAALERVTGGILVALGLQLATTSR